MKSSAVSGGMNVLSVVGKIAAAMHDHPRSSGRSIRLETTEIVIEHGIVVVVDHLQMLVITQSSQSFAVLQICGFGRIPVSRSACGSPTNFHGDELARAGSANTLAKGSRTAPSGWNSEFWERLWLR